VKTVVCFGDSNTWGAVPGTGARYPYELRWTTVLQRDLGQDYLVIPEGLSGRTAIWDSPYDEHLNGRPYLLPCLRSHAPVDVVAIMLGTNDVMMRLDLTVEEVVSGVATLVGIARSSLTGPDWTVPRILVIAPPPVIAQEGWDDADKCRAGRSQQFGRAFRLLAEGFGCGFIDAGAFIQSSSGEGVHFDQAALEPLGHAVADGVRAVLAVGGDN
jgi:lysophospholipase L1-like esterase